MRFTRFNLSGLRPVRALLALIACALMVFSYASPAYSDGYKDPTIQSTPSHPTEGEAPLNDIFRKAQEAIDQPPPSMGKQQAETNPGLNVDQGTADFEQMKRPDNTNAQSVEQSVEKGLRKATGR